MFKNSKPTFAKTAIILGAVLIIVASMYYFGNNRDLVLAPLLAGLGLCFAGFSLLTKKH